MKPNLGGVALPLRHNDFCDISITWELGFAKPVFNGENGKPMSPSPKSPQGPAFAPRRKCILVVDDEFLIRCMLSEKLRDASYQVIEACDATEALSVLKTVQPDLIISDVRMPGPLDGMDLLALVRETMPTLPVIIISGHLHPSRALIEGATQFVAKPYIMDAIVDAVQKALVGTP